MLKSTLPELRCPSRDGRGELCSSELTLEASARVSAEEEVTSGSLQCGRCRKRFPILAGVLILVDDVEGYLVQHVKGIARAVRDEEIPKAYRRSYLEAKSEIEAEHIEEDLESDRVNALYLMNHYLRVASAEVGKEWWRPLQGDASPEMDRLVREYWDRGPFARIRDWSASLPESPTPLRVLEVGCGVGGLAPELAAGLGSRLGKYLGVDGSFASIRIARHLQLGTPYPEGLRIPEDLLQGPVSREVRLALPPNRDGSRDFIVGELQNGAVRSGEWDVAIALNAIDMLDEPEGLPALQWDALRVGGTAIQSCPYIWHEAVAAGLRLRLSEAGVPARDSATAVRWLYENAGLKTVREERHVPWLFFKHVRQMELYSVHLFQSSKQR